MKKLILPLIASAFLMSCGGEEDNKQEDLVEKSEQIAEDTQAKEDSIARAEKAIEENATGINLWPKLSINTIKDGKLKWAKTIYFGREMTLSRDTVINKKTYHYAKIIEGTEGWVNAYCVAKNAKIGIVIAPSKIYKEPSPVSKPEGGFKLGDMVVVYDEMVGNYYQFVSQEKKKKGYLKSSGSISTDIIDIEAGTEFKSILEKEKSEQTAAFEDFLKNKDFRASVFGKEAEQMLEEGIEQDVIEQITDSVSATIKDAEEVVSPTDLETAAEDLEID